ncbi:MAG TPA: putative toxin-antitoxin system toxin component, PIN family [Ramlibacter sp.]|jgi:putative PIN family toxin of toxin-antitoxin system|uniref:putative toxin-antitoxin system toxin component, PIN family n=1 Tax=Ramlibacter sp. TaxID=1917967 RepID=UPI002D694D21|nr:putative toxin-antitoxin system toxin component, PIN family [Ramlibacter sp.]HZY17235.1 putative toxin-antitoxin system toxin component, PIN family [Ramlibacter sp.]
MQPLVLDTNVVLDVFVFDDAAARPLLPALREGRLRWLATAAMRDELARVLAYPQIAPRLAFRGLTAHDVLAGFDRHATVVDEAAKAPVTCGDPDDQKFIDLAVERAALLLSKDGEVLAMRKRLARLDVQACRHYEAAT